MRKSNYSFAEKLYNIKCVLLTRLRFKRARLVRTPICVRGKRFVDFGDGLTTGRYCQIEVNGVHNERCLRFGKDVNIGNNVRIQCAERVLIGNGVLIGSRVTLIDHSHGNYSGYNQDNPTTPPNKRALMSAPIVIEDNVWIGDGAVIQKGVTIGEGSVVASNSVVTKDVPAGTIVGGAPAHVIKRYNESTGSWEKEQG